MTRRPLKLTAAAALLAAVPVVHAYPDKPIRFIVPYAAGGSSDILARLHGQRLGDALGQTIVVDNRPGAGGMLGTDILAKCAPDGYSLMLQDMPHTINPAVYGKIPYDPVRDFTPITLVARAPQWLFVYPGVTAKTVSELVALAKAQPGVYKVGSAGNGSGTHLMAELFMRGATINLNHVPYKGAGPAVTATVAGEMNMVFTSMPAAVAFVQAGRLRAVGVTTAKRHPSHPEVPTFEESGVANMILTHWFGVLAPAGLPKPVVDKLYREFTAAVNHPAIIERYKTLVIDAATLTPTEFRALIDADLARWTKVVKDANIKAQ